jgi:lysine 6-dehydrogenase
MLNRVKNLAYKTIRYSGHMEKVKTLADLGFFDEEPREIDDKKVVPRAMSVSLLTERLFGPEPDVVLLRITAHGRIGKDPRTVRYQLIDVFDDKTGLSAMSRTTGFSAAQICEMLATGRIQVWGAIPQENCVPAEEFLLGLQQRGLNIKREVSD